VTGLGDIAPWYIACLSCVKQWIKSPALHLKKEKEGEGRKEGRKEKEKRKKNFDTRDSTLIF
jgi:hypothetical protein